ncbi:MAG: SDR family oxidoreductase [Pseudomonadota bacterium]
MKIAVTGATGQLGRLVLAALKQRGATDVVALARTPAKATDQGVEVRAFDYAQPATLAPALAGIDTLLLISSSEVGQREAQHRAVIDAARTAGVGRIVYTSLLHADASPLSLAPEHRATEAMLAASGIPATVLRNGWYTENQTGALSAAVEHGKILGSEGDGRISSAARADYAEAAAVVLTTDGHAGKTYELSGDTAFTMAGLAAEVSRQSGREVTFVNLPEGEYAAALAAFGLPADLAAAIAGWSAATARGALFDEGRVLSTLIGRPTTPMAQTVAAALAG